VGRHGSLSPLIISSANHYVTVLRNSKAAGGQVLGSVRVPLGTADFSSALLQTKASGAKVVGFANAGLICKIASSRLLNSAL
jgi:substrate-binding family protein